MENFAYKTRKNENPQGKQRIYFTCAPGDHDKYFEDISCDILKVQDCVIFYKESQMIHLATYDDLKDMRLFVLPITRNLLILPNHVMDSEVSFAFNHNIPILPLMQENGLEEQFNKKFGNLHFIDKTKFETGEEYYEKLRQSLSSKLIGDELAEDVRSAFDAYIFLSYRKEDHKYAKALIQLIHQNIFCRDIAIWYDDFLVPGEDFNIAIEKALRKCRLFALVVTPNLTKEENYVMKIEYPMARQLEKTVIPAEFCQTDKDELKFLYEDIPDCIDSKNIGLLRDTLQYALCNIDLRKNDGDPKHNFLIGLAYLNGIDTDVNEKIAEDLLLLSAEQGYLDGVRKIGELYGEGIFLSKDEEKAIYWFELYYNKTKDKYLYEKSVDIPDIDDVMKCGTLDKSMADSVQRILDDITTFFSLISLYESCKRHNAETCNEMAEICCVLFEKHYGRCPIIAVNTFEKITGYEIYVDENGDKKIGNAIYKDQKIYSTSVTTKNLELLSLADKLITLEVVSINKETRRQLILVVIEYIKKNMGVNIINKDLSDFYLKKYYALLDD